MELKLDTSKVGSWCSGHLAWLLPIGLVFLSWFAAERATTATTDGMRTWWGFLSILTGGGGVMLSIRAILILFEIELGP
jgi:hypothetical protein